MALRLRAGSATDVGNVRSNNQDDFLILPDTLFAVADGMGGHAAGDIASHEVVESLRTNYAEDLTLDAFRDAIRWANRAVWRRGVDEPAHAGMGTTLTAVAVVEDNTLAVANIGDSRTYLLRDGTLSQLTDDHSFVQEAVRTGQLTREQAESHPRRSQLTRAVGIGDDVDVDIEILVPQTGDRLLLCSDGLWDELPDEAISSILGRLSEPDAAAAELVRQAKEAGGRDNVTVVIVDVLDAAAEERAVAASAELVDEPTAGAAAVDDTASTKRSDGANGAGEHGEGLLRAPAPPAAQAASPQKVGPSARLVTWRVVLFICALLGLLIVTVFVFRGGRSPWKVRLAGDNVAIFKGDAVVTRTPLLVSQLDPREQAKLRNGVALENQAQAQAYVDGLARQVAATLPTATSSSTVAATTVASAPTASTAPIGP